MRTRTRRVRVRPLAAGLVRLHGGEAHHLARVLRVAPGQPVTAFDGEGHEADGEVERVDDDAVVLRLGEARSAATESPLEVVLAVALLKGDKLTQVVRQATELGAARITPILTRRSEVPSLSPNKHDRLSRVAAEAAKQSGRARVPEVREAVPLSELTWQGSAWVADPRATHAIAGRTDELFEGEARSLTVVTGPEGGLTAEEVDALTARGAAAVRLGPRVLRAETAPLAVLAAVLARVDE